MSASILYLRAAIAIEGPGSRPFTTIEIVPLDQGESGCWEGKLNYNRQNWRVLARIERVQESPPDPNQMTLL